MFLSSKVFFAVEANHYKYGLLSIAHHTFTLIVSAQAPIVYKYCFYWITIQSNPSVKTSTGDFLLWLWICHCRICLFLRHYAFELVFYTYLLSCCIYCLSTYFSCEQRIFLLCPYLIFFSYISICFSSDWSVYTLHDVTLSFLYLFSSFLVLIKSMVFQNPWYCLILECEISRTHLKYFLFALEKWNLLCGFQQHMERRAWLMFRQVTST